MQPRPGNLENSRRGMWPGISPKVGQLSGCHVQPVPPNDSSSNPPPLPPPLPGHALCSLCHPRSPLRQSFHCVSSARGLTAARGATAAYMEPSQLKQLFEGRGILFPSAEFLVPGHTLVNVHLPSLRVVGANGLYYRLDSRWLERCSWRVGSWWGLSPRRVRANRTPKQG